LFFLGCSFWVFFLGCSSFGLLFGLFVWFVVLLVGLLFLLFF